jgi:hypothetical protein
MGKKSSTVLFVVAQADAIALLSDLDSNEPSALYAQLFRQLTAAAQVSSTELPIPEDHAESFREWLDRAQLRHTRNGDLKKAQAFGRVRRSEH